MSNQITVINRTGNDVWVGIDGPNNSGNAYKSRINGFQGRSVLSPGQSHGFMVSGNGPYFVGYVTTYSGNGFSYGPNLTGIIVYNVFAGSMVTLATTLGTRPDPAPAPAE